MRSLFENSGRLTIGTLAVLFLVFSVLSASVASEGALGGDAVASESAQAMPASMDHADSDHHQHSDHWDCHGASCHFYIPALNSASFAGAVIEIYGAASSDQCIQAMQTSLYRPPKFVS